MSRPLSTLPASERPDNYIIPFELLPIPLEIKRQYTEEQLKEVRSTSFYTTNNNPALEIEFADVYDVWQCERPPSRTHNNWQHWRGWELTIKGGDLGELHGI